MKTIRIAFWWSLLMISKLSGSQQKILNSEQEAIINSEQNNIIVIASPGSGKTYTLVKKIIKVSELSLHGHKTFIACSFTNQAANQLRDKLSNEITIEKAFIGTIDSFVLKEIILPFKNRYFKFKNINISFERLTIKMPKKTNKKLINITRGGFNHYEQSEYSRMWFQNFKKGEYEISYPTYIIAIDMLKNLTIIRQYIESRYYGIYIDEAQDLNEFQHELIKFLKEHLLLKVFLIGDSNQSIYYFRGAQPTTFISLVNQDYCHYEISISVRCHKSILDFANDFLGNNITNLYNESNEVYIYENFNVANFDRILKSDLETLILGSKKEHLEYFLEKSTEANWDLEYALPLDFDNVSGDFVQIYYDLLTELLKFYYNYSNQQNTLTYSWSALEDFLLDYITKEQLIYIKSDILQTNLPIEEYLFIIFEKLEIEIPNDVMDIISGNLKNETYKNYYYQTGCKKRLMTIHGSKGLEANFVIVVINYSDYYYTKNKAENINNFEEEIRKYFVAFTRAKDELHLLFMEESINGAKIIQEEIKSKIIRSYKKINENLKKSELKNKQS